MKYSLDSIIRMLRRAMCYDTEESKTLFPYESTSIEWVNNETHKSDFESNHIQQEIIKRNNPPEGHHIVRINPRPLYINKDRNTLKKIHILESVKVLKPDEKYPKILANLWDLYKSGKLKAGQIYDGNIVIDNIYEGKYCNCEPGDDDVYRYLVIRVYNNDVIVKDINSDNDLNEQNSIDWWWNPK